MWCWEEFDPDGTVRETEVIIRGEREVMVPELTYSIAVIAEGVAKKNDLLHQYFTSN
jgi:hypothetical protein